MLQLNRDEWELGSREMSGRMISEAPELYIGWTYVRIIDMFLILDIKAIIKGLCFNRVT